MTPLALSAAPTVNPRTAPTAVPAAATTGSTAAPAVATTAPTAVPAAATTAPTAAPVSKSPTPSPTGVSANDQGSSNVEVAHERLQLEPLKTTLIIVSSYSTGVEAVIYWDLLARNFRATTGPDEGIDTRGLPCYPNCLFVPAEDVNLLSVDVWAQVLRHEYRHIIQASHNPNLAADYRGSDGLFTVYAAFSEACADFGLDVAPVYQAQARMTQLSAVLGADRQPLIDLACEGDRPSYDQVVQLYNGAKASAEAFGVLYPEFP